jgi:hypothetical protein
MLTEKFSYLNLVWRISLKKLQIMHNWACKYFKIFFLTLFNVAVAKLMKSTQKLTIKIREEFLVMHNHKWVCVYTMKYLTNNIEI